MIPQASPVFHGRKAHDAEKVWLQGIDEGEIRRLIGEHHGDQAKPLLRVPGQAVNAGLSPVARGETDLNQLDADPGHGERGRNV